MPQAQDPITFKTVVGLDIGQFSVKAARAVKTGGQFRITHVETLRLPAGMAGAETGAMIQRWLGQLGFAKEPCVIGLRGMTVLFQTLALPPQDPRPPEQAVAMEISRLSEISNEAMMYGFSPVPADDATRRFLIALIRTDKAEETLSVARAAGLDVVDVLPTPVAAFLTQTVAHAGQGGTAPVIVYADIGQSGTDVAVGTPAGVRFCRSFGIGGQFFTEALAKSRRMTASQAEPVKLASGMDVAEPAQKDALSAAAESWASELKSCLAIYKSFFPAAADQPAQVVLSGGGSHLKGFDRFLAYKLAIDVRQMTVLPGREEAPDPASYAVACGLALAGTGGGPRHISLLPSDLREALMLRRQKGYWMGAAAMAALVLGISLFGGYRDYQRKTVALRDQAASLARCQQLAREIEHNIEINDRLARMSSTVLVLLQNGPVYRNVISAIAERMQPNCWITLIADANTYFSQENLVKPEARRVPRGLRERKEGEPVEVLPGDPAFTRLIVEGYTSDPSLAAVSKLIASLKADGVIGKADLLGDDMLVKEDTQWAAAGGRRFVIDITL